MIYYLEDKDLKIASAVLRVSGPDANSYLQGQFTQDLRLKIGESTYGLWLDQKGKVLADSQVLKQAENDYLVVSFSAKADDLRTRLESYLIADEVELEDQTAAWAGILVWGEAAAEIAPPAGVVALPSRRAAIGGRQWLVPVGEFETARSAVAQRGSPVERHAAERARLLAAVPAVPADIGPRDLPNEGGLDETAISYTKGSISGRR